MRVKVFENGWEWEFLRLNSRRLLASPKQCVNDFNIAKRSSKQSEVRRMFYRVVDFYAGELKVMLSQRLEPVMEMSQGLELRCICISRAGLQSSFESKGLNTVMLGVY